MKRNIRRINDGYERNDKIGASDIYRKFKIQFEAMFNASNIAKNKEEFEQIYVRDEAFEEKLESFRNSVGSLATFCVGYTGIGKTTSIRYCFGLGVKKVAVYNADRKELVFPAFFDGHNLELNYSDDLAEKIGSVCSFIEKENPDLKQYMKTQSGKKNFVDFIQETKPEIVEVDYSVTCDMSEHEEIDYKLKYASKYHKYSYNAIRLKYMIAKKYDKYERLVIILDDVESLPHDYQQNLIRLYLSFFDCMTNTEFPDNSEYEVNLLISLRPHTYRLFNNNRNLETYPVCGTPITKDEPVDLAELFEKRFDYYKNKDSRVIGNIETWQECYDELVSMNRLFAGQYKSMIINLCFKNIREALAYYAKVFANRQWVQKNKEFYAEFTVNRSDYLFNNITVIRALACNESKVYFNDENNILPCLLLSLQQKDYSIFCILLLRMFYKRRNKNVYYGVESEKKQVILEELQQIFSPDIVKAFEQSLLYLFEKRIFRKSILDKDDFKTLDRRESLKEDSKLYLSSKGEEMWRMFSQDSVLLELFREEVFRDYDKYGFDDRPSFELMEETGQGEIFLDLMKYIEYLGYMEDDLRNKMVESTQWEKYVELFGDERVVLHLLFGVEHSLKYSGKIENDKIKEKYEYLKNQFID